MNKARVIEEHKTNYIISEGDVEFVATVRGSFFTDNDFPKVGDFVLYSEVGDDKAVIEEVLPRTSTVVRKAVETGTPQVIVANVDIIFIVMGLDGDFNISRLERYLLLAKQSNVKSVVVLNKSDIVESVDAYVTEVLSVTGDTPVHSLSSLSGDGMDVFLKYFTKDTTAVLLGSSGAGKSTIINRLLGHDKQTVMEVRTDDSRGRHTTTSRQLFSLPTGGFLIDTPGMRELSVIHTTTEDEGAIFELIDTLSRRCKFTNCDHEKSKGCAVLDAVTAGTVTERQLRNYLKLQRERLFEESKYDEELSRQQKLKSKKIQRMHNDILTNKNFEKGY
jgi:ribosome biogenesis GTPase